MKFLPGPSVVYPPSEQQKLAQLEALFREWHEHFAEHAPVEFRSLADELVFDGFYPHYFSQKVRVLFIGRECRDLAGCNYIENLLTEYRGKQEIGTQHLNSSKFHSRMLRIAHGLQNGMIPWNAIPYASEIGRSFAMDAGLSFAFMNISKLSNGRKSWQSDWTSINTAHSTSTKNRSLNREEIEILEPHLIVTMKLKEKVKSLGQLTPISSSKHARTYWLQNGDRKSLLIDTFHFSAPRKKAVEHYYTPICEAIRSLGNSGWTA